MFMGMDYFTWWLETYTIPDQEGETVTDALVEGIFNQFGEPETRDQERNSKSTVFLSLRSRLCRHKTRTSPCGLRVMAWWRDTQLPLVLMAGLTGQNCTSYTLPSSYWGESSAPQLSWPLIAPLTPQLNLPLSPGPQVSHARRQRKSLGMPRNLLQGCAVLAREGASPGPLKVRGSPLPCISYFCLTVVLPLGMRNFEGTVGSLYTECSCQSPSYCWKCFIFLIFWNTLSKNFFVYSGGITQFCCKYIL